MYYPLLFLFLLLVPEGVFARGLNYTADYKGPREPPFQKIYVEKWQIVNLPGGTYYYDEDENTFSKVSSLRADCDGTFVLRVTHQCPHCGRSYEDKQYDEEYDCPLFHRRISSRLWTD